MVIKSREMHRTCFTNRTWSISHHITPLVINALRGGHIDTHTYRYVSQNNFKKPDVCGQRPRSPGLINIVFATKVSLIALLQY